jgi:hypothetical protein
MAGRGLRARSAAAGVACAALLSAGAPLAAPAPAAFAGTWTAFSNPQPVTIAGYPASADEPFISPDGRFLLFNSSETEPDFTLQYALATAPGSFEYEGPIRGEEVNVPRALSGTPTLDDEGNLYWISNRSYPERLATVFAGRFNEGFVTEAHEVPGVHAPKFGMVDFDVGASPNGKFLYVAVGQFGGSGPPSSAALVIFERRGEGFVLRAAGESILASVNATAALVYAPAVTADELELFFTAASPAEGREPQIYRATRTTTKARFGHVERVAAITGFAEAPSISSDGTTLYYHEKTGEEVHIQTVTRIADPPTVTSVSPRYGPAAGGTAVTIKGTLLGGATAVSVGGAAASEVNVISGETITARTPPGIVGTTDVTVTTAKVTSAVSSKDHFTYRVR